MTLIILSLNGVSNTQPIPTSTIDSEPTAMSVNQCAPIITRGIEKITTISRAMAKAPWEK